MTALISVKQAVDDASMEIGIRQTVLIQAIGSRDEDVVQMTSLLNSVADDLMFDEPYQTLLGDGMWLVSVGGEPRSRPKEDTDLILFDARLAVCGLKYKFLQAKGLEFGEALRDYTTRLNKLAVRANDRVLDLDADGGRQI